MIKILDPSFLVLNLYYANLQVFTIPQHLHSLKAQNDCFLPFVDPYLFISFSEVAKERFLETCS